MENLNNLTDDRLKELLLSSAIDAAQKEELSPLISDMTEEERLQLLNLIEQSNQAGEEEIDTDVSGYNPEEVAEINEKFEAEVNHLVQDSVKEAYEDYEKEEQKEEFSEMQSVEKEMGAIEAMTTSDQKLVEQGDRKGLAKKSHFMFWMLLVLMILAALAVGGLYFMNFI